MPQFPITKYDLTHTHLYSATKLGIKKNKRGSMNYFKYIFMILFILVLDRESRVICMHR